MSNFFNNQFIYNPTHQRNPKNSSGDK